MASVHRYNEMASYMRTLDDNHMVSRPSWSLVMLGHREASHARSLRLPVCVSAEQPNAAAIMLCFICMLAHDGCVAAGFYW